MGAEHTLKKAIVVSAIGPQYEALYRKVAPTFEHYAAKHHWDIKVISELPDGFAKKHSRPTWDFKLLCCAFRLYQPTMFSNYDLLALMDPDMIFNSTAPCLSYYYDQIPTRGLAAVQDVSFSERRLFPGWNRCHYDDFLEAHEVEELPFPELHINGGLILVKPSDIMDEWLELMNMDSDLSDEDRLNLYFTQTERAFLLPRKWNVVYPYELVRRGYKQRDRSMWRFKRPRRVWMQIDRRFVHQRRILKILPDVYALHFASTDKLIPMNLDIGKLLTLS